MIKFLVFFYLVCFGIYVLFSRQPDYLDGELTKATIHFIEDSVSHKPTPFAFYYTDRENHAVNASYIFRSFKEGEKVDLIYETSRPALGAVYCIWGYWITAGEVAFSIGLIVVLYFVAVSITSNPTPEALMEQLSYKPQKKRKYSN